MNILLEEIGEDEFASLLPRLKEKHYLAGEVILEEESEGTDLHLIHEGRVKLTRKTKFGNEIRIALIHPGDFFGESRLIDGRPRNSKVSAVDDCTTYVLGKADFATAYLRRAIPSPFVCFLSSPFATDRRAIISCRSSRTPEGICSPRCAS